MKANVAHVSNVCAFVFLGLPLAILLTLAEFVHRQLLKKPPPEICSICLNTLDIFNPTEPLTCGHCFHVACSQRWHGYSDSCPICRAGYKVQDPRPPPQQAATRANAQNVAAAAPTARSPSPTTGSRMWMWLVMMLVQCPAPASASATEERTTERGVGDWRAHYTALVSSQGGAAISSDEDDECDECTPGEDGTAETYPPRSKAHAMAAQ